MKQTSKELLLKDLCARLPYGVEIICESSKINLTLTPHMLEGIFKDNNKLEWKPYLFPLSSMTEEQKKEISKRYNYHNPYQSCVVITNHSEGCWDDDISCNLQDYLWLEDWFNKNHIDYRGLIPMGLAIDATGLNIY